MNKPQFTRLSVWLSYWLLCATQAQAMSPLPPLEPDYNNAALVAQWIDDDPELPQALTSTSPEDFTASDYGCHTYIYRTAAHTYNLFFTTKKPVLETQIEYQQKTRDVKKTRLVDKTRQVKKTRQVQKTRQVSKVRTVTKTREVWKTTQVANVIYPVYKTRQILKTRTVYAPWWWWSFGMGWHSWEEPYWVTETYTTFELKWEDQRYRAVETYKEQEPYTATENYTVTEPYSVTETYSDIEAYTDQETYTETVEVKKVVSKDCRQQLTVISLMDDINTDKAYRFVLDNNVGLVVKVSAVQAKQTQGPLAYRILELTAIDALSSTLINSILPIVSNVEYKQRESYWLRLNSIHIKKLVPHIPVLSLSQGLNSLKLAWNNTKYTDNYGVEVAYNGNNWQTLATVKSDQYVFPYNSQWHLDKTQFRINACRDNGNTCSRSNSQALSTAVTKPIASDKHLIAMANTPIEINLAESNNNKFMHTSLPKYGQAILAADGMLTYTPTAGYAGVDELSYKISNKNYTEIHSNSAKITISVIAFTGAAEADRINGNTQATEAIKSIISISKPKDWVEIEAIEKQAAILATKAFKEANQALATAKQKAQAGLTTAAIDAAKADTINGNTQATNAIANALDTATTLAETDTKKTQAITGAQNALIQANQALATAKQKAQAGLTTADSNATKADTINGDTQAVDAVANSINTATTIAEIASKTTEAITGAQNALIQANQALAAAKQKAQAGLTTAAIDAAKADTINGNTQATNAIANALDTATTLAETDTKKTQAITGAQNALIGANQALATAKQQAITALTTADSNATKADTINGDTQAANAIANALDTAATITEIASKTTEAITGAQNALIQANQALAAAKQKAQAGLTTADSNAAKADTINGNTQATNAIENALDTATTLAQIATQKTQAITGAQNALIGANQALATAKQQAITALTTADSDAAKADTIKGDTQAVDAVANSINTATTIAEIASKTTEASAEAKQALAKAVKLKIKPQLTITIDSPASLTTLGATPVTVSGKVAGGIIALTVNGAPVTPDDGRFTADVSLREGHNSIVARAVDGQNNVSTASISVSLDMTPPTITVESPTSGKTLYSDKVTVTGLINDIVRGTIEQHQANVIANGIAGTVSNRSYSVKDIPLQLGENKISLTASDQVGNSAQKTITIHYKQPLGKKLQLLSGQDQSAQIGAVIDQPLAVKVVDDADAPVADQAVVFRVIQGSGALAPNTEQQGRAVAITTNADGEAQTNFRLGQRVGTANHKVRATITGYAGEITFNASGLAKIGNKISINSGNNQRGVAGQPLPAPFVVAITDAGANVVSGSRVKFQVTEGSGRFYDSKNDYQTGEFIAKTDSDGRVSVQFILGQLQGLDAQRVTATLIDSPQGKTLSAGFTASAFIPADPGKTSLSGVVLNNQDQPLQGVTLRIEGTTRQAVSNDQGRFTITEAPVGPVHLIADGSTALASGEYPSLGYQLVTIAGVDNPMATPIYMVKLDIQGAQYAGKKDISLTLEKFPGFQLDIAKGSVTFPDGAKEGFISVTSVNASAVPMAPPNGMQPQFIVTIQPAGTLFDPPARLSLPNVDGHAPGAQVEMYSFDHDLEEFVAIGLGTVAEDGSVVATNAGVGVIKAGWHCGSQPADSGCVSGKGCPFCQTSATNDCNNNDCVDDPAKAEAPLPTAQQTAGDCQTATCGGSVAADDKPADEVCKKCENKTLVVDTDKEGSAPSPNAPCAICQSGNLVNNQQLGKNVTINDPYVCKTCQSRELHNKPDSTAPLSNDRCQICQNGQLKSKLELNDVPEPAKGAELEFDVTKATKSAGSLIKKINTGLSKLGIAAEVSNVTIGAAGKFKHCCVPETGEIKQNQTQEASAQVGLTIEAKDVRIPGFTYGLDDTEIIFGPAFAIRFSAQIGVLISANTDIAISTGLRVEGCGGDTCNFGGVGLGFSPTLKPTAKLNACVEFFSNQKCAGGGVEAPISTGVSGDLNYNKTACNQGISGTVTIDPITAKGRIFAELGAKEYPLSFGPIQLYEGGSF